LKFCVLAIVLSGISACTQSSDCFREDVFCAALVTDTRGLNDFGLNQDTWAGLEQSHSDGLTDQIAYIESVNSKDYEKNIASFADAGYDVIITSGAGLSDATLHNADLYPESVFIGINQVDDESIPNFISVTFPEDQMGFLAGVLAARLTKTKIVGAVCETSGIDSMERYCEGFRAGVNYADESVKSLIVYRDNESRDKLFIDSEWGYDNAQNLIQEGSDVIFAAGGETAVGALRAAGEADVRSIGVERDQGMALGEEGSGVVTSILGSTSLTVKELMRRVRNGDLTDTKLNPIRYIALDSSISKSLSMEMDELLTALANGEIETNVTVEKP
jgi:basic membrane protein A